jgi:DNA-binding NtrC family response regulator
LARVSDQHQLEVERATDRKEALAKALEGQFDLLITDIRLPGIDGVELTEQVRRESPATSVIWITAYGGQRLRKDAERLGVYICLDKPLEIGQIEEVVRAALHESEPRADQRG